MVCIYSPEQTKRLDYVVRHIFRQVLGIDCMLATEKEIFLQQTGACINYSAEDIRHGLWIVPQGLLSEKGVRKIQNLDEGEWQSYFCFFRQTQGSIPFDIFSASFYLLTSYEEYFPKQLDEHGRFALQESLLYRHGSLEVPLVDRWAYLLKELLEKNYSGTRFNQRKYRFISTFDIDFPYLYRKKGILKNAGGLAKELLKFDFKGIKTRLAVHFLFKPDPYMEAIRWIEKLHEAAGRTYYLFILMNNRGRYGRKTIYPLKTYYRYLKNLDSAIIGLHPSYDTYGNPNLLIAEKEQLEKVLDKGEITSTRQHFLRMRHPQTFRELSKAGFREDFTMTFAHAPGFRSGTAIPYYFYDVEKDEASDLILRPTVVMDSTLIFHQQLNPDEALKKMKRLAEECKKSGGDYLCLWHNSNMAGAREQNPWIHVFEELFHDAASLEK